MGLIVLDLDLLVGIIVFDHGKNIVFHCILESSIRTSHVQHFDRIRGFGLLDICPERPVIPVIYQDPFGLVERGVGTDPVKGDHSDSGDNEDRYGDVNLETDRLRLTSIGPVGFDP